MTSKRHARWTIHIRRVMITWPWLYISVFRGAHPGLPQIHKLPALTLINAHFSLFPTIDYVYIRRNSDSTALHFYPPFSLHFFILHCIDGENGKLGV